MAIFHVIPAGDLAIENGRFVFLRGGPREVRQRLAARFRFFKGEWFLDTRLGVPYFQSILGKAPNLPMTEGIFRRLILTTRGVLSLASFTLRFDPTLRQAFVAFHAKTTEGDVIVRESDPDFTFDVAETA